jgi:uncharacterized phage-associated protein
MKKVKYLLRYIVKNYPYKNELSKTRITKMIYLADWYSALDSGKQLTEIKWFFDHYGPYVPDVFETAKKDRKLKIKQEINAFGNLKEIVVLNDSGFSFFNNKNLSEYAKNILDKVIEDTKNLSWTEFINYIYSSYPIKNSLRYSYLNLEKLSQECKKKNISY